MKQEEVIVSELKRLEAAEKKKETDFFPDRAAFMAELAKDFMTLINRDYIYESVNYTYRESLDQAPDILGRHAASVWGDEIFEKSIKPHLDACFTGEVVQYETWFSWHGRKLGYFDVTFYPFRGADNQVTHAAVLTRDLTKAKLEEAEKAQLEEIILESQKREALGKMAGEMAHEFNNLLAAISGYAELLDMTAIPGSKESLYLEKMNSSIRRGAGLTKKILSLSRVEATEMSPMFLNAVLRSIEDLVRSVLPPEINVEWDLTPDLPPVRINPNQIEQVLLNLAFNARDSMAQGGVLHCSTSLVHLEESFSLANPWASPGDFVRLRMKDTGCGMPCDVLRQVFDPFFTTKGAGRGTGLGLSVVRSIVKNHNGGVVVDSEPGRGSCFDVFIPVFTGNIPSPGGCEDAEFPELGQGKLVLVVDDDPAVRQVISQLLQIHGYKTLTAANGREAVELYRSGLERGPAVKAVVMDLAMPVMNGAEACDRIFEIDPDAKIILATGRSRESAPKGEYLGRAAAVMEKPFELKELVRETARVLKKYPCVSNN